MILFDDSRLVKNPMVSVRIITYNHSRFIEECLDSILNQETNFEFEIVIGDDQSMDDTREILKRYQEQYPNRIKLLFNEVNLGSNKNIFETNNHCNGKYVAWCDGDDFWTSNNKLQKQVDLLESRDDISLCFHNAYYADEQSNLNELFVKSIKSDRILNPTELFEEWYIANSSVFFRNHHITAESPDFVWNGTHGDLVYYLLLTEIGLIYYQTEPMSTYRMHGESITATAYNGINHNDLHIAQCHDLKAYFKDQFSNELDGRIENYELSNVRHYISLKDRKSARKLWKKVTSKKPGHLFKKFKTHFKIFIRLIQNK